MPLRRQEPKTQRPEYQFSAVSSEEFNKYTVPLFISSPSRRKDPSPVRIAERPSSPCLSCIRLRENEIIAQQIAEMEENIQKNMERTRQAYYESLRQEEEKKLQEERQRQEEIQRQEREKLLEQQRIEDEAKRQREMAQHAERTRREQEILQKEQETRHKEQEARQQAYDKLPGAPVTHFFNEYLKNVITDRRESIRFEESHPIISSTLTKLQCFNRKTIECFPNIVTETRQLNDEQFRLFSAKYGESICDSLARNVRISEQTVEADFATYKQYVEQLVPPVTDARSKLLRSMVIGSFLSEPLFRVQVKQPLAKLIAKPGSSKRSILSFVAMLSVYAEEFGVSYLTVWMNSLLNFPFTEDSVAVLEVLVNTFLAMYCEKYYGREMVVKYVSYIEAQLRQSDVKSSKISVGLQKGIELLKRKYHMH